MILGSAGRSAPRFSMSSAAACSTIWAATFFRPAEAAIGNHVHTALLLNPFLTELELLKGILRDFGIAARAGMSKQDLITELSDFLISVLEKNSRAVVLLDEAQNIPMATLEQIRILSNLETNKEKLLQIILVGQPELAQR